MMMMMMMMMMIMIEHIITTTIPGASGSSLSVKTRNPRDTLHLFMLHQIALKQHGIMELVLREENTKHILGNGSQWQ